MHEKIMEESDSWSFTVPFLEPVISKALERQIEEAARIIKSGGLVVYPTETVYGLGADATNRIAVLKVYAAKKRPLDNPLSVAVKDMKQAESIAIINAAAKRLAEAFLPGPLTIVLKKAASFPKELTASSDTLGIRIPNNVIALRLIELAGPITATSANLSGQQDPRTAEEAKKQLGDRVNFFLDGGSCKLGQPSTVVDVSVEGKFKIIREGSTPKEKIEEVLKVNL